MTDAFIAGNYSTSFSATENPISEGGAWINGAITGIDWGNVQTIAGFSYGTNLSSQYADPTAVLAGTWASDQEAQATIAINGAVSGGAHEVELRLHTTITAHSITGYEINANTNPNDPYIQIVRWDGPLNSWTLLDAHSVGVANGDVLEATAIGDTITVYKNGIQVLQVTDSTYSTGSPGIGFYDNVDSNWTSFGFSDFSASNVGSGQPTPAGIPISPTTVQNDYFGIVRVALPLDQATTVADAINTGTQTEVQYVNGLLAQVANTTIPAVAVEASMYGAVGSSAEITNLVTQFLPPQVSNAIQYGLNPQIYASEALGLVFAFNDENGGTAFASHFGPSNASMPATAAGDAAFAAAAASAIFGSAATADTPGAILGFVSNWESFYASHGVPGVANATAAQIDLAARGAAWGDAVGVALANHLGPLTAQTTEFLMDAAQGTANYSASLVGQPQHHPFQGEIS